MVSKRKIKISSFKLLVIVILVLTTAFVGYKIFADKNTAGNNGENPYTDTGLTNVNYEPATDEEKAENDAHKDKLVASKDSEAQNPTPTGQKKSVTPVISSWGIDSERKKFQVNGYVSDIYENGGECIFTLTKDGQKFTVSTVASKDARTTNCMVAEFESSQITGSGWSASLTYSSNAATGTSQKVELGN